jgi:AmmeMemoRadiSam system protein A
MFTETQQRALIERARTAVTEKILGLPDTTPKGPGLDRLPEASGAFVTLKRGGQLRGCIGTLECTGPLDEEVARVAVSAAVHDPRFEPLRASELEGLSVEVSVLGPLERIDPLAPDAIVVGSHGLVAEQGERRGLLLPQVAIEHRWDRREFLSQTCRKAGLPVDAWQHGATIYRFGADVFGD